MLAFCVDESTNLRLSSGLVFGDLPTNGGIGFYSDFWKLNNYHFKRFVKPHSLILRSNVGPGNKYTPPNKNKKHFFHTTRMFMFFLVLTRRERLWHVIFFHVALLQCYLQKNKTKQNSPIVENVISFQYDLRFADLSNRFSFYWGP